MARIHLSLGEIPRRPSGKDRPITLTGAVTLEQANKKYETPARKIVYYIGQYDSDTRLFGMDTSSRMLAIPEATYVALGSPQEGETIKLS